MSIFAVPGQPQACIGAWTNWSHGKVLEVTLILSQGDGNFLVAFIALFISIAGMSFLRITCFALRYIFSSKTAQNVLYHQRQAILRNTPSGTNALYSFGPLLWYWTWDRKHGRPVCRLLPLVEYSTVTISAFVVAGIYSSRIAALTGDEALISAPHLDLVNDTITGTLIEDTYEFFISFLFFWVYASQ
ncbi:hypothetical protein K469DRAFT_805575 [Zopfia rhizophila CBS 207.26]|uniref:Uncharacterized protein n=1 Tax=Zopfia rhizophila CBS 207.26 TaxID=1314779 RepID=A0A6A6DF06_9PEZI|nr:hypothetical protein K469DRAFT_805575 [Zopfia rhizophila CBS 207.26]